MGKGRGYNGWWGGRGLCGGGRPGRAGGSIQRGFGRDGRRDHTQKEVADHIGISQSYISRLEKRILKRLAVELREE